MGKNRSGRLRRSSVAKADCLTGVYGTAEAVPFHKTFPQNPMAQVPRLFLPYCFAGANEEVRFLRRGLGRQSSWCGRRGWPLLERREKWRTPGSFVSASKCVGVQRQGPRYAFRADVAHSPMVSTSAAKAGLKLGGYRRGEPLRHPNAGTVRHPFAMRYFVSGRLLTRITVASSRNPAPSTNFRTSESRLSGEKSGDCT